MNASFRALAANGLGGALRRGLRLRLGPFTVAMRSSDPGLARHLTACYPDYELANDDDFAHCGVTADLQRTLNPLRKAGVVRLDDGMTFTDYPPGDALPYVEWAINWCIATRCHFYLMLHAAVVERNGRALVMPGLPGVGKSTLCTYLVHNGWRHLSDEFCLLRPGGTAIVPFPRLIPLKNDAIDLIGTQVGNARIGPRFEGTRKGTVAHVSPPDEHVRSRGTADAALIVVPAFAEGAAAETSTLSRAECFVELSKNAFNYQILGRAAFETVADLVERAPAYRLGYGELGAAARALDALADRHFT